MHIYYINPKHLLLLTSLEDLGVGAATCKLVNFVDLKVQSLKSFGSPSEVLQKSSTVVVSVAHTNRHLDF